jgi:hypothetical protein
MIVRFFNTGTSNGESAVSYLMRDTDHAGNSRPEAPEVLEGSPEETLAFINSIGRKHKFASGCLAFRPEEKPNKAELFNILDQFKAVVAPGLEQEQFNALFVLHHEAPDPKTGQSGFHVHFLLPMTLLGGVNAKNKRLAGKRWNPHPPGKQTIEVMSLFTQITNHENGWQPVQEKPTRVGMDPLWRKATHLDQKRKIEILHTEVLKAIKGEQVHNRQELMTFMEDELGLTVTRASEKTVSVRFPGTHKAVRLKGAAYEYSADYKQITSQSKTDGEQPNIDQAKDRLAELLRQRAQHITDTPKTTKRKEQVYGKQSSNRRSAAGPEKANARGGLPPFGASKHSHGAHQHPHVSGRLERNLLQTSGGQWSDSHGWNHPKNGKGPGDAPNQPQQVDQLRQDARESGARTGRQWWGGRTLATFSPSAEIDEQIRALSIQLNDCPLGSLEAKAISDQLNVLQGVKQSQYGAPSPAKKFKPR